MKPRLWSFAIVLGAAPLFFWVQGTPLSGQQPPQQPHVLMGAGSCAAAACHNNYHDPEVRGEHMLWIKQTPPKGLRRDPHARAYESLFNPVAVRMQKNLHRAHGAHEDPQCLKCHVAPEYVAHPPKDVPYFKTDGVGCESCHGPAKDWINVHHLDAWQTLSQSQKRTYGMYDTQSLLGRVQRCARCHVGEPGMDVDHELIAAGHPRLNFEFSAFQAEMPTHWPTAKDRDPANLRRGGPDLEARAWVIGQLVGTQAALELLTARAEEKKKAWPEFAEHDCLACHHDLQNPSFRQKEGFPGRRPGVFPWGNYVTMTPIALASLQGQGDPQFKEHVKHFEDAVADLQKTMASAISPNRDEVAKKANAALKHLRPLLADLNDRLPTRLPTDKMLERIVTAHAAKAVGSVDEATQIQLGLAALHQSRTDMRLAFPPELRDPWLQLTKRLEFPKSYERARIFDPEAIRNRVVALKSMSR